jgi:hypothetical protein
MNAATFANVIGRTLVGSALTLAMSLLATGTSEAETPSSSKPERAPSETNYNMKINIKISDKTLAATLADNPTARDFVSLLPLKVSMNDLFGREKYGDLPRVISEKGPRTHTYQVGDIAYWSPDHQLAVYYRHDNQMIPSPGVIPIAKIDSGTEAFNVSGFVKVTFARAE